MDDCCGTRNEAIIGIVCKFNCCQMWDGYCKIKTLNLEGLNKSVLTEVSVKNNCYAIEANTLEAKKVNSVFVSNYNKSFS